VGLGQRWGEGQGLEVSPSTLSGSACTPCLHMRVQTKGRVRAKRTESGVKPVTLNESTPTSVVALIALKMVTSGAFQPAALHVALAVASVHALRSRLPSVPEYFQCNFQGDFQEHIIELIGSYQDCRDGPLLEAALALSQPACSSFLTLVADTL
jgi:hypothetical protein